MSPAMVSGSSATANPLLHIHPSRWAGLNSAFVSWPQLILRIHHQPSSKAAPVCRATDLPSFQIATGKSEHDKRAGTFENDKASKNAGNQSSYKVMKADSQYAKTIASWFGSISTSSADLLLEKPKRDNGGTKQRIDKMVATCLYIGAICAACLTLFVYRERGRLAIWKMVCLGCGFYMINLEINDRATSLVGRVLLSSKEDSSRSNLISRRWALCFGIGL